MDTRNYRHYNNILLYPYNTRITVAPLQPRRQSSSSSSSSLAAAVAVAVAATLRRPIRRIYTYSSSVRPSTEHATSAGCVAGLIHAPTCSLTSSSKKYKKILIYCSRCINNIILYEPEKTDTCVIVRQFR